MSTKSDTPDGTQADQVNVAATSPTDSIASTRVARIAKASALRDAGLDPYPSGPFEKSSCADALGLNEGVVVKLAGRLMSLRTMGNVSFGRLHDESGDIQIMVSKKEFEDPRLSTPAYTFLLRTLDIGDFIWVEGTRITTKTGEPTVLAARLHMISKSLRALPEKYAGLRNEEVLLRKRYLDILLHRDVQEMIYKKATFWRSMRQFFEVRKFTEVQTPVLEHTTGGADAKPFITHHNFLDADVALRISMGELWQKRLLVGGMERVFEIGRQFRNENQSREHANDYEQMEFYWAYANHEQGMALVEGLFKHIIAETFGTLEFTMHRNDKTYHVDLAKPWERYDYAETIEKLTGINIATASLQELRAAVPTEGDDSATRVRAIDRLWKFCRRELAGPGFLINEPLELSPLAKRNPANPDVVERFHVMIAGSELGNGYSELNDPVDQLKRFEDQQRLRDAGDAEAQELNLDFVEALEYGMPPAVGFGMSERVFAFFMDKSLRECQIFPLLRPLR